MRRLLLASIAGLAFATAGTGARAQPSSPSPPPEASPLPAVAPSPTAAPSPAASAGVIPPRLALTVTGNPADPGFLLREIHAALDRAIRPTLQPGASIQYGAPAVPLPVLPPGYITTATLMVRVSGAQDQGTVLAPTTIDLTNEAMPLVQPPRLFFDDDPEYVTDSGLLFRGTVAPVQATRLYYYHDVKGLPKNIAVLLTAPVGPTRVQLVGTGYGPNLDVMSVGHDVTKSFLLEQPQNEGIVTDVVPGAPFVLRNALTLNGELVAGSVDIRVVMGGPVTVTVLAVPAGSDPRAALGAPPAPRDGLHRSGTFDISGVGFRTIAYTVGGPDASYVYGGRTTSPPNVDPASPGRDIGDYGVLQRITFDVANPSAAYQPLYLYESAHGGPVRSSFLVDGQLKELGCARLPTRYLIASYQLPPRSQSAVRVVTMSDGGSNYPLEIGLSQAQPQPTTPLQNAPDGCFPKPSPPPSPSPSPSASPSLETLPSPDGSPSPQPSPTS